MSISPTYFLSYFLWAGVALNGIACALSFRTLICAMRDRRIAARMRVLTFAYEKQLEDMGAKLPVRCVMCCQVLPDHVEDCILQDLYKELGFMLECLTRPPIKYLPKNRQAS